MVHMTVNLVQIRFASFHTFRGEMVLFRCKHYKKEHLSHYAMATWLEALLIFPLVLLSRVNITEQHERHAVLMLDEIKLTSGLAYNPSKRTAIGRPTIPSADDSCPEDALATHALVFIMLGGVLWIIYIIYIIPIYYYRYNIYIIYINYIYYIYIYLYIIYI